MKIRIKKIRKTKIRKKGEIEREKMIRKKQKKR